MATQYLPVTPARVNTHREHALRRAQQAATVKRNRAIGALGFDAREAREMFDELTEWVARGMPLDARDQALVDASVAGASEAQLREIRQKFDAALCPWACSSGRDGTAQHAAQGVL